MPSILSSLHCSSPKQRVRIGSCAAVPHAHFVDIGKTLEQMAEIFGDEVDPHEVLSSADVHEKLDHDNLAKS